MEAVNSFLPLEKKIIFCLLYILSFLILIIVILTLLRIWVTNTMQMWLLILAPAGIGFLSFSSPQALVPPSHTSLLASPAVYHGLLYSVGDQHSWISRVPYCPQVQPTENIENFFKNQNLSKKSFQPQSYDCIKSCEF